jgi:protein MAK11
VKAIDILRVATGQGSSKVLLTSVSSDGFIHVYDTSELDKRDTPSEEVQTIEPFARYDTKGTRLTCVTFGEDGPTPSSAVNGQKRKRSGDEDNEEGNDEDAASESEAEADVSEES